MFYSLGVDLIRKLSELGGFCIFPFFFLGVCFCFVRKGGKREEFGILKVGLIVELQIWI